MKKIISLLFLFSFIGVVAFSQSNSELFRRADDAFKGLNYNASALFYKKILFNLDSGRSEGTHPYEVSQYTPPTDSKKKSKKSSTDSKKAQADSLSNNNNSVSANNISTNETVSGSSERMFAMERLAMSYKLLHSYKNTEEWYQKLYEIQPKEFTYEYARALMMNGRYKKAMDVGNKSLLEMEIGSEEYTQLRDLIKSCAFAIQTIEKTNDKILLLPLDSTVNIVGGAFAANYSDEEGYFLYSSSRSNPNAAQNGEETPAVNCNIYKVFLEKGVPKDDIQNISPLINTQENEGAAVMSPDKTKIYFTRWNNDPLKPECAIYASTFFNGQWLTAKKLGDNINAPGFKTMHPALSSDGTILYFSSNKPGGIGGMDIWYCTLDSRDNTQEVLNAGPVVNTPNDEVTPYFHINNFLYFSSDGHPGLGGLDIFKVKFEEKFFPPAKNLGSPMNSDKDDAYYVSNPEAQIGFISTDRNTCEGCGEGNCYQIYYFEDKPIVITISGKVYEEESLAPVANAMIEFLDVKENYDPIYVFTDEKGEYKTELIRDIEYFATAQKKGFFKSAVTISTMGIEKSTDLIQDFNFVLPVIPKGPISISGIEYDLNSATLRDNSKLILDTLVDMLTLNDNFTVKINSHTDERGNDDYNLRLSIARAKAVVDYLVANGIDAARLQSEGFGETKLLIPHATTEPEHQKNRRTEFDILSQDYQSVDKYQYLRLKERREKKEAAPSTNKGE